MNRSHLSQSQSSMQFRSAPPFVKLGIHSNSSDQINIEITLLSGNIEDRAEEGPRIASRLNRARYSTKTRAHCTCTRTTTEVEWSDRRTKNI